MQTKKDYPFEIYHNRTIFAVRGRHLSDWLNARPARPPSPVPASPNNARVSGTSLRRVEHLAQPNGVATVAQEALLR